MFVCTGDDDLQTSVRYFMFLSFSFQAIRQEFAVASNSERPGNKKDEDLKPITPIISEEANSDTSKQR